MYDRFRNHYTQLFISPHTGQSCKARPNIRVYQDPVGSLCSLLPQVSAEDRYRPSPTADSRRPLPSLWHPSRCTLRRLHGNHLHICRPWSGAFRKGQPNSIIELWHAGEGRGGVDRGLLLSGRIGKNKEGIRAVKTTRGLQAHGQSRRGRSSGNSYRLMSLVVAKCTDILCICVCIREINFNRNPAPTRYVYKAET